MKSQVNLSKQFKLYILILGIGLTIGLAIPIMHAEHIKQPDNTEKNRVNVSISNETCIEYNITGFCYNENGEYELPKNTSNNIFVNESVNQSSK